jgi:arginyl-tRNA synthetase
MSPEKYIIEKAALAVKALYGAEVDPSALQVQVTRKEFEGDYTLVVFPLLKISKSNPEGTGNAIGEWLKENFAEVAGYNVVKGFLNISFSTVYWNNLFAEIANTEDFGQHAPSGRTIMVEYSSPNTNKPLHLGHIRNNLLGFSVAKLLEANGHNVMKVNLVNDRGIHICKSMYAWKVLGNGETPASSGKKGDHLVGDYYVAFNNLSITIFPFEKHLLSSL